MSIVVYVFMEKKNQYFLVEKKIAYWNYVNLARIGYIIAPDKRAYQENIFLNHP